MKIAQVAPLAERVPPVRYGGTERIVSYLVEELVRAGHDVTLFASGDSETSAELVAMCPRALRLDGCADPLPQHILMLGRVFERIHEFDIVHFHVDYLHFPLSDRERPPHLTTLHGRLDLPYIRDCFHSYRHLPFVSISDSQRRPMPWLNWRGTVYHGLPPSLYRPADCAGDYAIFVGRISPEKRLDRAIEIAARAGVSLVVAAKVDRADRAYFETRIRQLLRQPHVEYLGEVGDAEKASLLCGARSLLFPIDWPEPFGIVMIEAMACGTPVIAWRNGSVPEVVDPGVTGFIVESMDEATAAVDAARDFDRAACRRHFELRFSAARMADDYVDIYQQLALGQPLRASAAAPRPPSCIG